MGRGRICLETLGFPSLFVRVHMRHNQNLVLKWSTENHGKRRRLHPFVVGITPDQPSSTRGFRLGSFPSGFIWVCLNIEIGESPPPQKKQNYKKKAYLWFPFKAHWTRATPTPPPTPPQKKNQTRMGGAPTQNRTIGLQAWRRPALRFSTSLSSPKPRVLPNLGSI